MPATDIWPVPLHQVQETAPWPEQVEQMLPASEEAVEREFLVAARAFADIKVAAASAMIRVEVIFLIFIGVLLSDDGLLFVVCF